jgi:hypothetical protein
MWRAAGSGPTDTMRAFTLGAMMVFVDALVRSLTSPIFVAPPIAYFTFGVCAIALSVAAGEASDVVGPERVR